MSITRDEAIQQLKNLRAHCDSMCTGEFDSEEIWDKDVDAIDIALDALEEQQIAEWIEDGYGYYRCSACGWEWDDRETVTPYCPHCGAHMEGEE